LAAWLAALACALAPGPVSALPSNGGDCAPAVASPMRVDGTDLVLHDERGAPLARWPLRDANGRPGTPIAVCRLAQRQSWVVAVAGWLELWEISTDRAASPIFDGLVHDYRMAEAIARPGYLGLRRIRLERPWTAVWADGRVPWVMGAELGADHDAAVLHLNVRRVVGRMPWGPGGGWAAVAGRRFAWGPGPDVP
jgi:hypothetical protein